MIIPITCMIVIIMIFSRCYDDCCHFIMFIIIIRFTINIVNVSMFMNNDIDNTVNDNNIITLMLTTQ